MTGAVHVYDALCRSMTCDSEGRVHARVQVAVHFAVDVTLGEE